MCSNNVLVINNWKANTILEAMADAGAPRDILLKHAVGYDTIEQQFVNT